MKKIVMLFLIICCHILVFSQDADLKTPELQTAYNVGYQDGLKNETYNYTYQGRKADLQQKEEYEKGKLKGLVEYYYSEGLKVGLKIESRVPSDYQYADGWGEPIELVESFKAGLAKGKEKFLEKNDIKKRFNDEEYQAIVMESIFIGMREEALLMSYGNPNKINTTQSVNFMQKQYIYNRPFHRNTYVYIENGKISGWQNF